MKTKLMFFPLMVLVLISASAQERGPAPVSPSSVTGIARVGTTCPTFSWTSVEWAADYRVVVFETNGPNVLSYKEMEAISSPVLSREIKGRALSWTPSSDERLSSGHMYVWFVQAVDGYGTGIWSEGRMFEVEAEVHLLGLENAMRESLRKRGVSEEVIEEALEDMRPGMKEVVAYGVDTEAGKIGAQDIVGIQGLEGDTNTFYGLEAGFSIAGGNWNTFIGLYAGHDNTTGYHNTFIGHNAGHQNTIGYDNSFMGFQAGYDNTTGYHNTFIGYQAGRYNSTGLKNTFVGFEAGINNSTGGYNSFVGYQAGYNNFSGFYNTFIGYNAGHNNSTAYFNTFIGHAAGHSNSTGNSNTYIGYGAGHENNNGAGNVFIGNLAGYYATGSSKLFIDNSSTSSPLIWGSFENNILTVHGKLGVGTKSPAYAMELETTGTNAAFVAQRTDGATNYINATASFGNFGTVTNHPLRLAVNSVWRMRLDSDNSLTLANGAMCTAGGTWQNYSKREAKENIHDLTTDEAMDTLKGLVAVKYNYKVDKEEKHVGFIAEDVPDLVASKDRNGISAMDIVAVLTKVVQEQQEMIKEQQNVALEQQRLAEEQQKTIDALQKQIDDLKIRGK